MFVYHHKLIPESNPFDKVEPNYRETEETVPATYAELQSFISAALALGELGVAIGARLCWDMHIRPTEVFGSVQRSQWRPAEAPHQMWVGADKTSKGKKKSSAFLPIDDVEAGVCLFPELESLIRMAKWDGPLLCMRERQVGNRTYAGEWRPIQNASKITKRIRVHAGLPDHVTLESFRHGGLTELGSAGVSDELLMSRSLHRQRQTLSHYLHATTDKPLTAQKMRLAYRSDSTGK
jgi:hypothetical protein